MKNSDKLTTILESILFVSGTKVAVHDISDKLGVTDAEVLSAAKKLKAEKYGEGSGIQLLIFNNKLQFSSDPDNAEEVSAVLNPIKEKELSKSMLEVAAIIAYRQPVTRIDLEEIRGTNSEYAVQKLLELGVIEPVGRKDAVGKPVLFGTTDEFLKRFQISSLEELPNYDELMAEIKKIHEGDTVGDYLYTKDTFVADDEENADNENAEKEVAATDDEDLPPVSEEEKPDFLDGEDVDII